ncbi:MAG: torS [Bacteroidetes bacterium]|jgi:signal transduction histidine kinase|nr:torS [Bacteroidota bacterium]
MENQRILHDPSEAPRLLEMTCDTMLLLQNDGTCVDIIVKTDNPYINESSSLVGKNIFEIFPKVTIDEFKPEFDQVVCSGEQSNKNYDLPAADKMYYFKCIMQKYDDAHVLCQYRDITQRSQMKKRLESANITLREVERAAKIGHWSYNISTRQVNYMGYAGGIYNDQETNITFGIEEYLTNLPDENKVVFEEMLRGGGNIGSVIEFHLADKNSYLRCKIINDHYDGDVRIVEGYIQNISDIVKGRQEMEMVLSVVDNSMENIYANMLDGSFIFANKQCRLQNRIPKDADIMQYKAFQILDNIHGEEYWTEFVERLHANNGFLRYICDQPYEEFGIIASDCTSYIIKNGVGEDIVWSFRRDISDQLRYEQELKRAKEIAEESGRLKSAFISNMSHEIRTPLNAIVGFSGIIAQTDDPDQRHEYYKIVQSNSNQLLRLVNEVLDLSRMESGKVSFNIEPHSLNGLGEELEATHRLSSKSAELYFDKLETDFILNIDRGRLVQVMSNLIVNAIKFTPHGSIHFGCIIHKEEVEFYVRDTGVGIESEYLDKVFNRFVKINDFDRGTGLGLAICKAIVEKMGGKISLESVVNKGTIFRFTVPININQK